MIGAVFGQLGTKIFGGLSIALLIVCLGLWVRGNRFEGQRDKARTEVAQMQSANREATAKQIAQNLAVEAAYKRKAEETDAQYQVALDRARSASERYAVANRVRPNSGGSRPPAPAPDQPAPRPSGPGEKADMVAVLRSDFDILVENTVRLEAAHSWAKTLTAEPLPEVKFGPGETQ